MNNGKKEYTLFKRYASKPGDTAAAKQVRRAVDSGIGATMVNVGWKVKRLVLNEHAHEDEHVIEASVTLIRAGSKQYTEENFEKQADAIWKRIQSRGRSAGWFPANAHARSNVPAHANGKAAHNPLDGLLGPEFTESPRSLPWLNATNPDAIEIPENYGQFFTHIYDREDQIAEVMESVRTAKDTSMETRNHVLLFGPPGCGKTEIGLAVSRMLGEGAVKRLDATATTKAGAENLLLEMEQIPPILIIEELEKVNEANLPWLLGILDDRGEIIKTNARVGSISRQAKCLVIATVNNLAKFQGFQEGALCNRFGVPLYCPMPDRALLRKILVREVAKIPDGKEEWIEPTLDYALNEEKTFQARRIKSIMTNARDRILTGEYQEARRRMNAARESDTERLAEFTTESF